MKISVLVKIDENLDFGKNCRQIMMLVNILGKSRFQSISSVNFDFGQNFPPNPDFGQNFWKMSIWVKICKYVDLGQIFPKISILVKIFENIDFGDMVEKSQIWKNLSKNLDFGQTCRKLSILVKI